MEDDLVPDASVPEDGFHAEGGGPLVDIYNCCQVVREQLNVVGSDGGRSVWQAMCVACSSRMLICICASLGNQRPWAVWPSKWVPHPTSEVSMVRVVWNKGE